MTRGIAKRGGRPAWHKAPRALRQSDIGQPFAFLDDHAPKPGLLAKLVALLERGRGR